LGIEWIEGSNIRKLIPGVPEDADEQAEDADENESDDTPDYDPLVAYQISAGKFQSHLLLHLLCLYASE
jgi:hypothetical protein